MDRPIGYVGVLALVIWLLEPFVADDRALGIGVNVLWLGIAGMFLVEFVARALVARDIGTFMRRHWWELALIVMPFLRFLRVLRAARAGRGIAATVRSTRSAGQLLRNRLAVLLLVTVLVTLAGGRFLWEFGDYAHSYPDALHDAAMSTLTGTALGKAGAVAQVFEVVLAAYSAVIVATIAGSLGAFFLEGRSAIDELAPMPRQAIDDTQR
jgi:voltage-gated potassium channel